MVRVLGILVGVAVTFAAPAFGKVVTVCGGLPQALEDNRAEVPAARPFAAYAYAAPGALIRSNRVALTEDAAGYDITLNWGEADEHSLRREGAEVLSMGLDESLVHLMVARYEASAVEHYLFQLDARGAGELLSGADTDDETSGLSRFTCRAP
jgi:hypothetical protein